MLLEIVILGGAEVTEVTLELAFLLVVRTDVLEEVVGLLSLVRTQLTVQGRAVRFSRRVNDDMS